MLRKVAEVMSISAMSSYSRQAAGRGDLEATAVLGDVNQRKTLTQVSSAFDCSLREETTPPASAAQTQAETPPVGCALTLLARGGLPQTELLSADTNGPTSSREGQLSPSGAPEIQISDQPITNQWGYTGPAARNPFFTTADNPMPPGLVAGFGRWFSGVNADSTTVIDQTPTDYMTKTSLEGAMEALRLVRLLSPGAQLSVLSQGTEGGTASEDAQTRVIVLPDGTNLNAGVVLGSYYQGGYGVSPWSDAILRETIGARSQDGVPAAANKTSIGYPTNAASGKIEQDASDFEHPSIGAVRQAMVDEGLDPDSVKMAYSSEFTWTPDGGRINNFLTVETDKGRKLSFSAELSLDSPHVTVCDVRHMLDGTSGWDQWNQLA